MSESLVPTVRTTPTMLDFARALLACWPEATKGGAGILWAHFAGETGNGRHCYCFNYGNVKWSKGCGLDYMALVGVWEGVTPEQAAKLIAGGQWQADPDPGHAKAVGPGKVSVTVTKTNPAAWFRAYPDAAAGMAAFVGSKRAGQWRSTWPFVEAADPDGYARELHRMRYYTASPDVYAASMKAHLANWMRSDAFDTALLERAEVVPDTLPAPREPEPFAVVRSLHYVQGDDEPDPAA